MVLSLLLVVGVLIAWLFVSFCSCGETEREREWVRVRTKQSDDKRKKGIEREREREREKGRVNVSRVCCVRVRVWKRGSCLVLWIMFISRTRARWRLIARVTVHTLYLIVQSAYYRHLIFTTMELAKEAKWKVERETKRGKYNRPGDQV